MSEKKFTEPSPNTLIAQRHPELGSLPSEVTLDIQYAEISDWNAKKAIEDCTKYLKVNGTDFDISQAQLEHIEREKLTKLFDEATGLRNPRVRYITALKIWFGMENDSIIPIFQPICLTWVSYDQANNSNIYSVLENGNGSYYRYSSGFAGFEFFPLTESDFATLKGNYESGIEILHNDAPTSSHSHFIGRTDIDGCVFAFQVIYSLMHYNSDSETIRLYNSIRQVSYDSLNPVKHTVLLSCIEFDETNKEKLLTLGKYANRSHLCPPCTNLFGYPA